MPGLSNAEEVAESRYSCACWSGSSSRTPFHLPNLSFLSMCLSISTEQSRGILSPLNSGPVLAQQVCYHLSESFPQPMFFALLYSSCVQGYQNEMCIEARTQPWTKSNLRMFKGRICSHSPYRKVWEYTETINPSSILELFLLDKIMRKLA